MAISQEFPSQLILRAASKAPYLKRGEEMALALRWAQDKDQEALHQLTSAHMRLVIALAMKFRGYGLPTSDVIQEGHVGLLEAAARFDPERGVRFSTYATWWIRASMQDYILRNWSIVRGGTSSGQKALFLKLRRLRAEIAKSGKPLNSQEILNELSNAIGVSPSDVAIMDARFNGDISLNATVSNDSDTSAERQDFLVSDDPLPDENVSLMIDGQKQTAWLSQAMEILNERELRILKARKLADEGTTLETLGNELGISKERVRQIEASALQKLRQELIKINPEIARVRTH